MTFGSQAISPIERDKRKGLTEAVALSTKT